MLTRWRRILFAVTCVLCACQYANAGTTEMTVQVKQTAIRATPSYLAPVVLSLNYGERLVVHEKRGNWCLVGKSNQPAAGWLHDSALTRERIALKAGSDTRTAASSDEVALAGKGFNSEVEKAFKANHTEIDFRWIDRMESIRIADGAIQSFLQTGAVTSAKGGAQ